MTHNRKFTFPVGYYKFHKEQVFNFQLNRWYSLGYARFEDMKKAGQKIETFTDWKAEMLTLAEKAVSEDRLMNAAFYYRAAEFYTLPDDPDKERFYNKFKTLFYTVFQEDKIEKCEVPYKNTFLPALKILSTTKTKGTIIMHGGFDSLIEEFYSMMRFFSNNGYHVIGFEGPGQGAALREYNLPLDYEWEKPTRAILDYFNLDNVTLLGISMGGWFCFRAAAFEPRIKRVIASSIAYDYMKSYNTIIRMLHIFFFKYFRDFTNKMAMKSLKKDKGIETWMTNNLMYITQTKTPMDAFEFWLQLNEKNLHSELVKQDVLILTGKNDHFIPFKMHKMQVDALKNAKSVTEKVFTEKDHAHNHCQIGNIGLALDVMVKWIEQFMM
ncbi:MAG: alpha/beta fold hydrolase [Candidatus Methanofastidiosia archaeon]|jgi:pimeloyl-ACP methyl ester carboxylesterase